MVALAIQKSWNDLGFLGEIVDEFSLYRQLHALPRCSNRTDALRDLSRLHLNPARQIPSGGRGVWEPIGTQSIEADGTLRRLFRRLRGPP
jgi:hypothetical protein